MSQEFYSMEQVDALALSHDITLTQEMKKILRKTLTLDWYISRTLFAKKQVLWVIQALEKKKLSS